MKCLDELAWRKMSDPKANKNLRKPDQRDRSGEQNSFGRRPPVSEVEEVIHDRGSQNIDGEEVPEHTIGLQHLHAVAERRGREALYFQLGIDPVLHSVTVESQTARGDNTSSEKRTFYQFRYLALSSIVLNSR